ncbi:low affinity sulfate transporter 3-like protein [Tanacetum coccineum]
MKCVCSEYAGFIQLGSMNFESIDEIHIVVGAGMSDIDYAGILLALEETNKKLLSGGIKLAIASPWQVIHKLKVAKFVYKVGRDCIFVTVNEAVDSFVGPKFNGPANY